MALDLFEIRCLLKLNYDVWLFAKMYAWVFARFTARKHSTLITYFQINRDYRRALYQVKMP
jgi:hypothetical protein